ncbi:MAG: VOC family protein [Thermoleophilia bacterium]|nr:VOC family protein [Thermoleophilia bacterium]
MSSTETARTVTRIANVIVPVSDQDLQLRFYTETLGLELRADVPFGNGDRWIEVAPAGAETPIALCPPGPGGEAGGKDTGITLQTADIEAYRKGLEERGADVDADVSHMGDPVPPLGWLRDPEGNSLMIVEVR